MSFLENDMQTVNSVVFVMDREDGKPYQCKILDIRDDLMKIHYHRWNSMYDEWLQLDSPRLV